MTRPPETGDSADLDVTGPDATTPRTTTGPAPAPEATQPITPPRPTRKLNITTAQVGAAAAASVTSALGASFLGAAGTIAGAAVGSVISTVAGAIYTRSLETAGSKLRETTVHVTRISNNGARRPGSVPTRLADVDEPPVSAEDADLETTVMAPSDGEAVTAAPAAPAAPSVADGPDGSGGGIRRKPLLVTAGVALAGFGLALGGISVAEGLLGHPVSGGSGGTSIGRVVSNDTSADQEEQAPEETGPAVTPSGETDPSAGSSEEPGGEATPTDEPTEDPGQAPVTEPTAEPGDETGGDPTGAPEEQATP